MVRLNEEMPSVNVVMKLFDSVNNGQGLSFQLRIVLLSRSERPRNVCNWPFLLVISDVGEDCPNSVLGGVAGKY